MFYQVIISEPFESTVFSTLPEAKKFVMSFYPYVLSVIRHRNNGRTIRITTFSPGHGFKTQSVTELYNQFKNQDFDSF